MIIYQVKPYALTIMMMVKCLMKAKYFILYTFHIKAEAVVGKYLLLYTVVYPGVNVDNRGYIGAGIFYGIGNQV